MSILRSLKAHIGTVARFFFLYHLCTSWLCEGKTLVNKRIFRFSSLPWGAWTALSPKPRGTQGRSCQRQSDCTPSDLGKRMGAKNGRQYRSWTNAAHCAKLGRASCSLSNDHFLLKSAFSLSSSSSAAAYIHPEGLRFQRRTKGRRQDSRRIFQ